MMTRSRGLLLLVSAVLLAPLAVAGFAVASDPGEDDFFKQFPVFQDVLRLVRQAYVDEVDLAELMAGAFLGLADALDPFSTLVPAEHVADVQELARRPSPSGMVLAQSNGVLYVVAVLPGGPAQAAEIRPGDIITEIDGVTTRNLPLWNAELQLARIPETSDHQDLEQGLSVGILHGGEQRTAILRGALVESTGAVLDLASETAILRLFELSDDIGDQVDRALEAADSAGVSGLMVDLRRSWGTDYQSAVRVAGLLGMRSGADFVHRGGERTPITADVETEWRRPVVVLVGQATHGAGELLARLLSEQYPTVGQQTFGYLGRPAWVALGDGDQLRTADGFYGPSDGGSWEEPLEPGTVVSGRDRRFSQKDQTLDELTEERGLEALQSALLERAA